MRYFLSLSFILIFSIQSFAQIAKLEGTVTDSKSGQVISGVSVSVDGGAGTASDMDGKFTLNLDPSKKHTIRLSSVGYSTKELSDVEVIAGEVKSLNIILESVAKTGTEIVIRSSARKESTVAMIAYQKNTNTVASVISAEAIRRSPDKNTGEILKRVPGTSVQEGKYLVVRGLADRYNQSMLNGILLSSTEPDRKTFSFDIFPSSMIENIVINKAFVPELPGEWAGGLVQVQTRDIPANNFLNIQLGTGFNSETLGKDFYQYKGGNLDWIGVDNGERGLPADIPGKAKFGQMNQQQQNEYGKNFRNVWLATPATAPLNSAFQVNGGFTGKLFNKKVGGVIALTYNQSNRRLQYDNQVIANEDGDLDLSYKNNKYSRDILAGLLANFSVQLNSNNRISFKNILNVNTSDFVIDRYDGIDNAGLVARVKAQELSFRQNTFLNNQVVGEHYITSIKTKLKWFAGFNILDQYIPDQKRLFYTQDLNDPTAPFYALLGAGAPQKSGSIFYSTLSDYNYTTGVDVSNNFDLFGQKQTIKAGYLFQVKDRLFNTRPFFVNTSSNALKLLPANQIFAPENFGTGPEKVQFSELTGEAYRYIANSILNAGYLQFENQFTDKWRLIWGVRVEHFDQVVGSLVTSDRRHVYSKVNDFLPGINLTYKVNDKTNIRLSGSQTIVRPEFRELSPFAFYDFELNAQIQGNNGLRRTKITNADIRYEIYPAGGELLTLGAFYKHFNDPLEYYFNRTSPATNTFNIQNTDKATAYGVEFEFRKKLAFITEATKNFTLTGNISYIHSRVQDTTSLDRPLQGQSPYLVNIGLQYDLEEQGFSGTLLFNQIGRRILFVGDRSISDIFESPRPLLDLQLSKKILKKRGEVKLNVSDIFNKRAYFYHDLDDDKEYKSSSRDRLAIERNYGTNYSISFSYSIK